MQKVDDLANTLSVESSARFILAASCRVQDKRVGICTPFCRLLCGVLSAAVPAHAHAQQHDTGRVHLPLHTRHASCRTS